MKGERRAAVVVPGAVTGSAAHTLPSILVDVRCVYLCARGVSSTVVSLLLADVHRATSGGRAVGSQSGGRVAGAVRQPEAALVGKAGEGRVGG